MSIATVTMRPTHLQVPIALDPALHEQLVSAEAELVAENNVRDVSPPVVKKIDPNGIAHIAYAFKGKGRNLLLGCPDGHASILVHFHIRGEVPVAGVACLTRSSCDGTAVRLR